MQHIVTDVKITEARRGARVFQCAIEVVMTEVEVNEVCQGGEAQVLKYAYQKVAAEIKMSEARKG